MDIARIEQVIERYVRFPETLSEDRRQAVELLLRESPFLKFIGHYHEEFYDEFDAVRHEATPFVEAMLDDLFAPAVGSNA